MTYRKSTMLAAVLAAWGSVAAANPPEQALADKVDSTTKTDEVAIQRDDGDRMTVAVSVSGSGPYRFLVDTGSERTVISRQLAQRLKLDSGDRTTLHSVVGANNVDTVFIPDLKVSGNSVSVVDAPALEASNIGADGMLGIDSLRSQQVTFDFKAKTMAITSAKARNHDEGDTIVVRAKSRDGRLIFTDATIAGQRVTVIVDTGSQVTIGNLTLQSRLEKRRVAMVPEPVTIESVTGEKMQAKVTMLRKLELGGLHMDNLAVAFADAHIFKQLSLEDKPAILLGMNAMRAFDRITIDFAEKKVRFKLPDTSMLGGVRFASLQ